MTTPQDQQQARELAEKCANQCLDSIFLKWGVLPPTDAQECLKETILTELSLAELIADRRRLNWLATNEYAFGFPTKADPFWYVFGNGETDEWKGKTLYEAIDNTMETK